MHVTTWSLLLAEVPLNYTLDVGHVASVVANTTLLGAASSLRKILFQSVLLKDLLAECNRLFLT